MINIRREDEPIVHVKVIGEAIEIGHEYYEGPYTVTPTADGLTLETDDMIMSDDLTISPVPYTETENAAGGLTVTIL